MRIYVFRQALYPVTSIPGHKINSAFATTITLYYVDKKCLGKCRVGAL